MGDSLNNSANSDFPKQRNRALHRYVAAVVATAAATLLRYALGGVLTSYAPLATYFASVAFAAWYGGFGPGMLAIFLGMVSAIIWFIPMTGDGMLFAPNSWFSLILFFANGVVICLFSAAHRRAARHAIDNADRAVSQQQQLDRVLQHMADGFVVFDSQWRFIYLNDRAIEMSGLTREALLHQRVWDLFPELVGSALHEQMLRAMSERTSVSTEFTMPRTGAWIRANAYPSPEGLIVFSSDITEEKRTGQAVVDLESRNRAILESALDGIISIDERGVIESVNPGAERLFGYTAAEMLGNNVTMLMPMPYQAEHPQYLTNYLQTGVRKIIGIGREVRGLRRDGSTFPMDLSVSEIRLSGRRLFLGLVHDITEHKLAEQQREKLLKAERDARVQAEFASRMKDEFLATLSHELRTPLSGILGWSQLLLARQAAPEDLQTGLRTIQANAESQVRLVEDLLDMSRIVTGNMRLSLGEVDLKSLVDATVQMFVPEAQQKGVIIQTDFAEPLPHISADASRIKQIIWNLVGNSLKFTPAGGSIHISVALAGESVQLCVRDTGIGIQPDFLPHLFARFRQADSSTTRRHGGLGLGLAIVRHLSELHGGSVSAASEGQGKGAQFTVTIPPQPPENRQPDAARP